MQVACEGQEEDGARAQRGAERADGPEKAGGPGSHSTYAQSCYFDSSKQDSGVRLTWLLLAGGTVATREGQGSQRGGLATAWASKDGGLGGEGALAVMRGGQIWVLSGATWAAFSLHRFRSEGQGSRGRGLSVSPSTRVAGWGGAGLSGKRGACSRRVAS